MLSTVCYRLPVVVVAQSRLAPQPPSYDLLVLIQPTPARTNDSPERSRMGNVSSSRQSITCLAESSDLSLCRVPRLSKREIETQNRRLAVERANWRQTRQRRSEESVHCALHASYWPFLQYHLSNLQTIIRKITALPLSFGVHKIYRF